MSFEGVDFYDVDGLLSEEERAVRDMVREWVQEELMPVINEHYMAHTFPKHLIPQMGELGFFGANLPEEYGCAGLNNVAYGLINQELERGDSGLRSFASVQGGLVMYPIFAFGSEEQRKEWLPKLATGEKIGCFGLTEPDFGSNPGGMLTRAVRDGDEWVLNGSKMWITNGSMADVAIIWAKTGDIDDARSIRGFIVETDRDGFTAKDQEGKLSLLASDTSELVLQDVRVPDSNLLPETGGLKSPLMCLTQARYGIAWGAVGAAMACFTEARDYAKNRVQFAGKPIAATQIQQIRLADMLTEITKGQLLVLQLGTTEGRRHVHRQPGIDGEAQQRGHRLRVRERGQAIAGRKRDPDRIPVDASHGEPGIGVYLRGNARHPRPDPRARDHGAPGVRLGLVGRADPAVAEQYRQADHDDAREQHIAQEVSSGGYARQAHQEPESGCCGEHPPAPPPRHDRRIPAPRARSRPTDVRR